MDASEDVFIFSDVDINFDDLDYCFDFATGEFFQCGGGGGLVADDNNTKSAIPAALSLDSCTSDRGGREESSPDSAAVTGGGSLTCGDGSMSGYASELERFLMEDNDVDEAVGPDGERTMDNFGAYECWDDLIFANDYETVAAATDDGRDDPAEAAEDDVAEPEDEGTSRKRTRRQSSGGTACMVTWEEIEMRKRHLGAIGMPRLQLQLQCWPIPQLFGGVHKASTVT